MDRSGRQGRGLTGWAVTEWEVAEGTAWKGAEGTAWEGGMGYETF
ncbi:MAG: hypothetical protein ACLRPY_09555 [Enterocloster aldenensis]